MKEATSFAGVRLDVAHLPFFVLASFQLRDEAGRPQDNGTDLPVEDHHGVAQVELVHGPCRRHVKQAPFLLEAALFHGLWVGEPPFRAPHDENRFPFKAFRLVYRGQDDPFILGGTPHDLFPGDAAHEGKLAQEIDERIIPGREIEELIYIFEAVLMVRIGVLQVFHVAVGEDGGDHLGQGVVLVQAPQARRTAGIIGPRYPAVCL